MRRLVSHVAEVLRCRQLVADFDRQSVGETEEAKKASRDATTGKWTESDWRLHRELMRAANSDTRMLG